MESMQGDYTPKPNLNDLEGAPEEVRQELEALRAGLLDASSGTIIDKNTGATVIDDAQADAEGPQA